jgi:catechol 2,3-dioxygenase-like lactoylglutathione lyase family enzyme
MQDAADHATVINPALATNVTRQKRLDCLPLLVSQPKQVTSHVPSLYRKDKLNESPTEFPINAFRPVHETMIEVERAIPSMFVRDLDASVAWYERVFGFRVTFRIAEFAALALGDAHIHIAKWDPPITAAFYLRLAHGVDEFVAGVEAKGVRLGSALKDHDYGMREATVHDPDGNEIYIGQPIVRNDLHER